MQACILLVHPVLLLVVQMNASGAQALEGERNAVDVMMDMAHDMIMKRVYTWHAHTRIIGWTGMPGHAR